MATHGKRARELAQQERRERKREKKAQLAGERAAGKTPVADSTDAHAESAGSLR
jgi:hypothetical protein